MRCTYCSTSNPADASCCVACGAPSGSLIPARAPERIRSEPFFYNGYMVYLSKDYLENSIGCYFWLGEQLVEYFKITVEALSMLVPEGEDTTHFFWKLFLIAQGEEEVLRVQEQNQKQPAMFEIRRIESVDQTYWTSLSLREIVREARV